MEVLEGEGGEEGREDADEHGGRERDQKLDWEVSHRVVLLVDVVLAQYRLEEHDCYRVVDHRLAEGQHVQRCVHLESLEDSEGGDRVGGGEEGPEHDRIEQRKLVDPPVLSEPESAKSHYHGRNDGPKYRENQDGGEIAEERTLVEAITALEQDKGEEEQENGIGADENETVVVHAHDLDDGADDGADDDGGDGVGQGLEPRQVDHVDENGADAEEREREDDAPGLVVELLGLVGAVHPAVPRRARADPGLQVAVSVGLCAVVRTLDLRAVQTPKAPVTVTASVQCVTPPVT
mmetsp:Transcript_55070/g.128856  ORF Transcript_55070/g.128856 Transcript_55070/m.128856 type:complete len:292 (-) Transcript_55070:739-1614(-)